MHATTPTTFQTSGFIFAPESRPPSNIGEIINKYYLADEDEVMREIVELARVDEDTRTRIRETAERLVRAVRDNRGVKGGLDAFMKQYDLSSQEGVVLMCLAEALLRIPDSETADKLIADKLLAGNWQDHLGTSGSMFVNASTWGLMLTGRIISLDREAVEHPRRFMRKMVVSCL